MQLASRVAQSNENATHPLAQRSGHVLAKEERREGQSGLPAPVIFSATSLGLSAAFFGPVPPFLAPVLPFPAGVLPFREIQCFFASASHSPPQNQHESQNAQI